MPYGAEKVDDFFTQRYDSLNRYCHSRWNGQGGDVLHSAWELAKKHEYTHINFSLFGKLCLNAARKLRLRYTIYTADGVIILPPTERAAERVESHLAAAPADNDNQPEFPADCRRAARRLIRQEKKGQMHLWSTGGAA
jgi:hypothetical protein